MSEEETAMVTELGKLGFPISSVAEYLQCKKEDLAMQFRKKEGEVYSAYAKGRVQGLVDIRRTYMRAAMGASTPSLERMLAFFAQSENENMEIWEE